MPGSCSFCDWLAFDLLFCSKKNKQFAGQIHIFHECVWQFFTAFPPFMTKSELQQPLFAPLLFFKEWREKFALVTLYKIETGSLLLQSLLTKEQPCLIRSHCSLQKSNGSDSLFSKSESLFRSFAHKKRAIRSKKTKSKFPPLTNTEWSRILKLQIRISNIFVKTIILRKLFLPVNQWSLGWSDFERKKC